MAFEPRDSGSCEAANLIEQPGLSDSRVSDEENGLSAAGFDLVERSSQLRELGLPIDQRVGRGARRARRRTNKPPGAHGALSPLDAHVAQRLDDEPRGQRARGLLADRDRSRLRGALEPGSDVRRVSERDALRIPGADEPDRRLPGVDADADVEVGDPPGALDVARVRLDGFENAE